MRQKIEDTLESALTKYGVELSDDQSRQITQYCQRLWDHNTRHNLTRHTDFDTFVARDVVDARELAQLLLPGETILDVGSGGGVPGILLEILRSDLGRITLSEFVGKKVYCLEDMVEDLGLPIDVVMDRAERVLAGKRFNVVTARAVGPLKKLLPPFRKRWSHFDRMLLIKGPKWSDELAAADELGLTESLTVKCVHEYPMPGRDNNSVVLEIRQTT